jgi:hypothetical protein
MKKGISLIVLVITIIVIIILAGAVILSLAQNNPIGQANQATREHDAAEVESALAMFLGTIMGEYRDQVKLNVTEDYAVLSDNDVAVVNSSNQQLYRDSNNNITTDPTGTPIVVTNQALGLGSWPSHPGYDLVVDQYANVEFRTPVAE